MILSKKYREAMDQIILSDEAKFRIMENATKNHFPVQTKPKHTRIFYVRYGVVYAACMLLCFFVISSSKNIIKTNVVSFASPTPNYTETIPDASEQSAPVEPQNDVSQENNHAAQAPLSANIPQDNIKDAFQEETIEAYIIEKPAGVKPDEMTEPNIPEIPENNISNEEPPLVSSSGAQEDEPNSTGTPIVDMETLSQVREQLGHDFKIPQYIPDTYKFHQVSLMFGKLVQISYVSECDEIIYRTEKTTENISGDYTIYETEETEIINGIDTVLKGNDNRFYNVVWNDNQMAYSVNSKNGLEKDTLVQIVESTDYFEEPIAPAAQPEKIQEDESEDVTVNGALQDSDKDTLEHTDYFIEQAAPATQPEQVQENDYEDATMNE